MCPEFLTVLLTVTPGTPSHFKVRNATPRMPISTANRRVDTANLVHNKCIHALLFSPVQTTDDL